MPIHDFSVFIKAHGQKIEYGLLGLILFTAGFQMGRVTSPYTTDTPIVFQDTAGQATIAGDSDQGDHNQLPALHAAPSPITLPARSAETQPAAQPGTQDQFVGSVHSDLFHLPDCPSVSRIKPQNQVWFATAQQAQASGYQPSQCTLEKLR